MELIYVYGAGDGSRRIMWLQYQGAKGFLEVLAINTC
jgi:hypothetical protein